MRNKIWTDSQLITASHTSTSIRQVLLKLNLRPAGGNYQQITNALVRLKIDTSHFTGQGWNIGLKFVPKKAEPLAEIMKLGSSYQSYKLKRRLFKEGFKKEKCELCGWQAQAPDGRVPVELDHINGNHSDNRLSNLRILCPNCHSLQSTHRGLNKIKYT